MNKFVKRYPFGSHLLTILVCTLILLIVLVYCKTQYFNISIDTNKRIKNIENHVVSDSLDYFATDTLSNG